MKRPPLTFSISLVRDLRRTPGLIGAWEELAANALEPNVFYEHWMLLPALRAYGGAADARVALVWMRTGPRGNATLAGLVPLSFIERRGRLKVSAVRLWQYPHCYLGTPLVRADCAAECVSALLMWLSELGWAELLELPSVAGDGPFHQLLLECSETLRLRTWRAYAYTRGLWRQTPEGGRWPAATVSAPVRRCLGRKERRLAERGRLAHVTARPGDEIATWIEDFLRIEARGRKGARGSALACSEAGGRFFEQIVTAAFSRRRLLMLGLNYDGQPIARRCAFLAGDGAFAFKTTYDERFAAHLPRALLEIDHLVQLARLPQVHWMDWCAAPDNALVNRIANGRRPINGLTVAITPLGNLTLTARRVLRWTNRRLKPRSRAMARA